MAKQPTIGVSGREMSTRPSYAEFIELIGGEDEVWVDLYDGLFICLVGADSLTTEGFLAKFIPCARNARVYNIPYNKVKALRKGKYNGC